MSDDTRAAHDFDPNCDCVECKPDQFEDDPDDAEQRELDAQMRYDRNNNTEWGW